jgi:lipoprotein-anchoring transpeptidase ErfK/SrfK
VSRAISQTVAIGNEFMLPQRPLLSMKKPEDTPEPALVVPNVPIEDIPHQESIHVSVSSSTLRVLSPLSNLLNFAHRYSLASFALLFLLVGSTGTIVGGRYWSSHINLKPKPPTSNVPLTHTIAGLSLAVPNTQLQSELQSIISQPASITVGTQTATISPDVIKSWLTITPSGNKAQDYLQVNTNAMDSSLLAIANQYVVAPVNQVSVTHTDGITPSGVILGGQNGAALSNPSTLSTQAQQAAKSVMNAKGLQFSTPLQTVPFQAVTPAAFPKLLEADVNTERLYAWQNGQLVNTFLATAGAPDTPTPIGEFQIWNKLTSQTMKGLNPNGTPYVQPNVPWINYFDHSGDAVHGNYWRPASVFGNVSTSHGCVGIPVSDGEWVYNWAPIGTTVITHT